MTAQLILSESGGGRLLILPQITVPDVISDICTNHYSTSYIFGVATRIADSDGDYVEWNCYFAGGNYTSIFMAAKTPNSAIVDIRCDGVDLVPSGHDLYAASSNYNTIFTQAISITSGQHAIRVIADGKNASAGGYNIYMNMLSFERTS